MLGQFNSTSTNRYLKRLFIGIGKNIVLAYVDTVVKVVFVLSIRSFHI